MKYLRFPCAATILALALFSAPAFADNPGTPVTHTTTHNDAAVFWVGQADGATSCNTVSETAAQDTITITPPAGYYVYLTGILIQNFTNATGVTQTGTISFTNISTNGGLAPFISFGTALSTSGQDTINLPIQFPVGGLKSAQPGVAVTIVPSATQSADNYLCMSAYGYFSNN